MWPFRTGGAARAPYSLPLFPLKTVLFPGGLLPLKVFEQRYIDMTKACLKDSRPFGVCLITQGEEVATPAGRRAGDRQRRHAGAHHRLGHAAARHPARRDARARRASRSAGTRCEASGLVVGEVTPIAGRAATQRSPTSYQPLAQLLELIATRVGPQNFPAEREYDDASWVGYRLAELLPLPLPSSRACSRSTMRKCGCRCCRNSWRSRACSDACPRATAVGRGWPEYNFHLWQTASRKDTMAGHSKWANIKHKKAATDAKRGKIFTRLIKEITVAARLGGGDASMNPRLRLAVDKAMSQNMPKDTIERATKRGAGDLEGVNYEEIRYEGYGINGAAVIVDCMTDNRTRTVADVRHAFSKYGGNLGTDGSVAFLFKHCGQIVFAPGTERRQADGGRARCRRRGHRHQRRRQHRGHHRAVRLRRREGRARQGRLQAPSSPK